VAHDDVAFTRVALGDPEYSGDRARRFAEVRGRAAPIGPTLRPQAMPEPPLIITIGTSAGGIDALSKVVAGLEPGLPAAVFVAMHIARESVLAAILDRHGALPAEQAMDGAPIEAGRVYVAPPDYHLTIEGGRMRVARGPRENGHRPSIDTLFRSAARVHRSRVVGVLLTGLLDDGVAGLFVIRARGGVAVVQDPDDAVAPDMPRQALRYVGADHCVPAVEMGPLLSELARGDMAKTSKKKSRAAEARTGTSGAAGRAGAGGSGRRKAASPASSGATKGDAAKGDLSRLPSPRTSAARPQRSTGRGRDQASLREALPASPAPKSTTELARSAAPFVCPECHGPLFEVREGELRHWRCIVGHGFSPESLTAAHTEALERALWIAGRTLQERVYLRRLMADRRGKGPDKLLAEKLQEGADTAERDLVLIREILNRI
jgi:two-component system, chemotaxis family, protein-glutamate methylesterase/glutaminase